MDELPRDFASRDALARFLAERFPAAAARSRHLAPTRGGRRAAETALLSVAPGRYARSRNFLDGAVTRLSPYVRHGVLTLAEIAARAAASSRTWLDREKFVSELAWRDYYQRVYAQLGARIWDDVEPAKTGVADYADALPSGVDSAETGRACIDGFLRDLYETGYLHNHARMWFASWFVHHARSRWQRGAELFLTHLLDGDPASNNLSWQWVASTFSHKPYVFNRENLERYTNGAYCRTCPLASGGCPFDATYDALDARLFERGAGQPPRPAPPALRVAADSEPLPPAAPHGAVVWHHDDALGEDSPVRRALPDAPAVYAFDGARIERMRWSLKRLAFVYETLLEMNVTIVHGPTVESVRAFARAHGAGTVAHVAPIDPELRAFGERLASGGATARYAPDPFVRLDRGVDLGRFSRYWRVAERSLRPRPAREG